MIHKILLLICLVAIIFSGNNRCPNQKNEINLLKIRIQETWSIAILRIIFEFLNHDDFMKAIHFYNLTSPRLDGLKVKAAHKRTYGTQIVEYYGDWEYDVNGILFPFRYNIKQMAMMLYEHPTYVNLYDDGILEVKSKQTMEGITPVSNVDSFFIKDGPKCTVSFFLDLDKYDGEKHIGKILDISFCGEIHTSESEFYEIFYVPFSAVCCKLWLHFDIKFFFHEFDVNNFTDRTYFCRMKSSLFRFGRNGKNQITNVTYSASGALIDINMIRQLYPTHCFDHGFDPFYPL